MNERSYSPRTVADALGVSESSLKRWCDQGKLEISKTAGGHRKIPRSSVLAFAREHQCVLSRPDLLELPDLSLDRPQSLEVAQREFLESLIAGNETKCRQLLVQLYFEGHRISRIGDRVVATAMHEIGHLWQCAEVDIYQERLGCEICTRLFHDLRAMLRPAPVSAPLAIGATPPGDPYSLPTSLVELVLREHGWQAINLGCGIPFSSLDRAITELKPQLFWLSVSTIQESTQLIADYQQLFAKHGDRLPIVIGGRALTDSIRAELSYSVHCDRLEVLDHYLKTFRPSIERQIDRETNDHRPPSIGLGESK